VAEAEKLAGGDGLEQWPSLRAGADLTDVWQVEWKLDHSGDSFMNIEHALAVGKIEPVWRGYPCPLPIDIVCLAAT
jgi:hypothetical protein